MGISAKASHFFNAVRFRRSFFIPKKELSYGIKKLRQRVFLGISAALVLLYI